MGNFQTEKKAKHKTSNRGKNTRNALDGMGKGMHREREKLGERKVRPFYTKNTKVERLVATIHKTFCVFICLCLCYIPCLKTHIRSQYLPINKCYEVWRFVPHSHETKIHHQKMPSLKIKLNLVWMIWFKMAKRNHVIRDENKYGRCCCVCAFISLSLSCSRYIYVCACVWNILRTTWCVCVCHDICVRKMNQRTPQSSIRLNSGNGCGDNETFIILW